MTVSGVQRICLFILTLSVLAFTACSNPSVFDADEGECTYAAGYAADRSDIWIPGYWKNGVWYELKNTNSAFDGYVRALAVSGGSVYAAGYANDRSGASVAGTGRTVCGRVWPIRTGRAATRLLRRLLCAGATCTRRETCLICPVSAFRDTGKTAGGRSWLFLRNRQKACMLQQQPLPILTSDIAGYTGSRSSACTAGYWKNGVWSNLANVYDSARNAYITSLVVRGADVYAAGSASDGEGVCVPGYWKNGVWVELGNVYDGEKSAYVTSFALAAGGAEYAGGYALNGEGTCTAGYWKNGVWAELSDPYATGRNAYVTSIAVSDSAVLAGGVAENALGVYSAGCWKNGQWFELPNAYSGARSGYTAHVNAVAVTAQ